MDGRSVTVLIVALPLIGFAAAMEGAEDFEGIVEQSAGAFA
jgi:hypothetical protein